MHLTSKTLSASATLFAHINERLVSACGVLLLLQMLYQVCDVTARYVLSRPLPGTMEISESVLVFITFLCGANVLSRGGHVRVTLLLDRLTPVRRVWLDVFCSAVGCSTMFMLAWRAFLYGLYSYHVQDTSGTGTAFDLPLYPAKFAFFVGCALLCLQFFGQMLGSLSSISSRRAFDTEEDQRCLSLKS
jgi:TRAP-type mannitol/chloroaromatic compound transport system permease small subunit